ncbi:MAG: gliding motility-associated C-terminal domain-containing protein [Bacteroidales bacterium]|nr:gliding motility-associated C-terminal domain-containing protein [Candidatus Colimorpha pelethequi]
MRQFVYKTVLDRLGKILLLLVLLLSCAESQAQTFGGGSGTAEDPYLISSQQELEQIYQMMSATNQFAGTHFLLTNDLVLTNFRPFSRMFYATFSGHFDGGGHNIHYVSFDTSATYNALFYTLQGPGVLENLTVSSDSLLLGSGIVHIAIDGATIRNCVNLADVSEYDGSCGGVVNHLHTSTMENCVNRGTVYMLSPVNTLILMGVGGIAGMSSAGVILHCENYGNVFHYGGAIGGIVGRSSGVIENCRNYGEIFDTNFRAHTVNTPNTYDLVGGIVGFQDGFDYPYRDDKRIVGCSNYGTITLKSHQSYVGGIVGTLTSSPITTCANAGDIHLYYTEYGYVGGIGGQLHMNVRFDDTTRYVTSHCVNTGNLTATMLPDGSGLPTYLSFVGGISGYYGDRLSHCMNAGSIMGDHAGGIVGQGLAIYFYPDYDNLIVVTTMDHCLNVGQVKASRLSSEAYTMGRKAKCVEACYYDKQMCTAAQDDQYGRDASRGLTTLQLVDGDTLTQELHWKAYAGMYPWPRELGDNTIAHAAATPVFLRQSPNPNFTSARPDNYTSIDSVTAVDSCFSLGSGWRNTSWWQAGSHSVQVQGTNYPQIVGLGMDTLCLYIGDTLLKKVFVNIQNANPDCHCIYNHVDDTVVTNGLWWVDGNLYENDTHRPTYYQDRAPECDTLRHLELIGAPYTPPDSVVLHLYDTICHGDTLLFESRLLTSAGRYCSVHPAQGYDTIVWLHLFVDYGPVITIDYEAIDDSLFRIDLDAEPGIVSWTASPTDSTLWGQEHARTLFVSPLQTTRYDVSLQYDDPSQCANKASVTIVVETPEYPLYAPNVFTPGAETNNRFLVKGKDVVSFEMFIFNRWGMEVWHTNDINEGWDGRHKGIDCPQAAYVYRVHYSTLAAPREKKTFVGTVSLVR